MGKNQFLFLPSPFYFSFTSYKTPLNIAREFASLDLTSKNRAAWDLSLIAIGSKTYHLKKGKPADHLSINFIEDRSENVKGQFPFTPPLEFMLNVLAKGALFNYAEGKYIPAIVRSATPYDTKPSTTK